MTDRSRKAAPASKSGSKAASKALSKSAAKAMEKATSKPRKFEADSNSKPVPPRARVTLGPPAGRGPTRRPSAAFVPAAAPAPPATETPRPRDGAFRVAGVVRDELPGRLIVLEGPDGSGRSSQIALLTEWLESNGHAVQTIGLRRSNLVARDIDEVMARNQVGRMTLALMYATDFFDQFENTMIPALRAGHIVLADRYIYTLMARAHVRGIPIEYVRGIYELAFRPHLAFWLNIRPEIQFQREFQKSGEVSYWESGRDINLSDDLYESFVKYQSLMRLEFERLSREDGFVELDAETSIRRINDEMRRRIAPLLGIRNTRFRPSRALMHLWVE